MTKKLIKKEEETKKKKNTIKDTVTDNTHHTDNTDNTDNTDKTSVLCVLCDNATAEILFEDNTFERILKIFATSKEAFTYDKLAELLNKKPENIRQAIGREKTYFEIKKPDGKKAVIHLSHIAIEKINLRIANFKQKEAQKQQIEAEKEKKISKREELIIEAKKFFDSCKKSIGKQLKQGNVIIINFSDLAEFSLELSDELMGNPEEILRLMELAFEETGFTSDIRIRIINLPEDCKIFIENIRSKHLNELISVEGRVVSITDVRPQVVNAKFECPSCGTVISVLQMEKKFREPSRCSCGRRGGFKLISEEMVDTAKIILEDLQEKTDNPHTRRLNIFIKEDLTSPKNIKMFTPGNEIKIVGILKKVPMQMQKGGLSVRFDLAVEVNSVELSEEEVDINKFTEQEIKDIKSLSKKIDKDGLDEINNSFAPHVYGYEEIKMH